MAAYVAIFYIKKRCNYSLHPLVDITINSIAIKHITFDIISVFSTPVDSMSTPPATDPMTPPMVIADAKNPCPVIFFSSLMISFIKSTEHGVNSANPKSCVT